MYHFFIQFAFGYGIDGRARPGKSILEGSGVSLLDFWLNTPPCGMVRRRGEKKKCRSFGEIQGDLLPVVSAFQLDGEFNAPVPNT